MQSGYLLRGDVDGLGQGFREVNGGGASPREVAAAAAATAVATAAAAAASAAAASGDATALVGGVLSSGVNAPGTVNVECLGMRSSERGQGVGVWGTQNVQDKQELRSTCAAMGQETWRDFSANAQQQRNFLPPP